VKLTVTTGTMRDTMAHLAVPVTTSTPTGGSIRSPRRSATIRERIAALSYTRLFGPSSSLSTTAYRISASGDYDVQLAPLTQFNLDFVWYGVTSDWNLRRRGLSFDVGVNANDYSRDHFAFQHPDLEHPLYFNTGHKGDVTGFTKLAYTAGANTLFGDLQARHAEWRYLPDANADITPESIAWTFVNPKVGVTHVMRRSTSVYVSSEPNTREPARGDMLAGFDNLDTSNVAFVGDLHRVKPRPCTTSARHDIPHADDRGAGESVLDELSQRDRAIGQLSYIGNPLRENVGRSYRRGVEGDITYRGIAHWMLTANVAAARTDQTAHRLDRRRTGDVPRRAAAAHAALHDVRARRSRRADACGSRSRRATGLFLQNTDDPRYVLPASLNVDGSASWRQGLRARREGSTIFSTPEVRSATPATAFHYYVLPPATSSSRSSSISRSWHDEIRRAHAPSDRRLGGRASTTRELHFAEGGLTRTDNILLKNLETPPSVCFV
jgi:iron complex outermembrane receptor protein